MFDVTNITHNTGRPPGGALSAAMEDYLEAVGELARESGVARVRDIARRLGVHMPSVTAAMKVLARRGLVNYDPYQYVTLTPRGRQAASEVSGRHDTLRTFFADVLGLDPAAAEANACRVEHVADGALLERLARLAKAIRRCPLGQCAPAREAKRQHAEGRQ
jgi:DtxR family Mn-dependent transcriptional regulator